MNKDLHKNLRRAQKLGEKEYFFQADGLMKKVRKLNGGSFGKPQQLDAEKKMREIQCFWKENWEYNHAHSIFIEPRITKPNFYIRRVGFEGQLQPSLQRYYELLNQFVQKLKIEHQDQTNYKINLELYPLRNDDQLMDTCEKSLEHLMTIFQELSSKMKKNYIQNQQKMMEYSIEQNEVDSEAMVRLQFLKRRCASLRIRDQGMMEVETDRTIIHQAVSFMAFVSSLIGDSKPNSVYSSTITVQPEIGSLTYVIHPLCLAFYGNFSQEVLVKYAKKERGKLFADAPIPPLVFDHKHLKFDELKLLQIGDNYRVEQQRHSKVLFINLDGYQSEYNLEFVRNFSKHLMYVSFPKFDKDSKDDLSENYNKRFYKKIMFNSTKSQFEPEMLSEEKNSYIETLIQDMLRNDPEWYQQSVEQIYRSDPSKNIDINENVYIYPIGLENIKGTEDITNSERNIEQFESNFIRYIMKDYLYSEMRKFRPTIIFLSYTGKLSIQHDHFIEMMQQLHRVCSKIILFPNYTTTLASKSVEQYAEIQYYKYDHIQDKIGKQIIYPPTDEDRHVDLQQKIKLYYQNDGFNPCEVELMDIMAIFLKISAGHYNVDRFYEEEKFDSKLKNSEIFNYMIYLFSDLQNEYDHCKKRIQKDSLKSTRDILQKGLTECSAQLERCISPFHKKLFNHIQSLLNSPDAVHQHTILVEELRDRLYENDEMIESQWNKFRKIQEIILANEKYHEISYVSISQSAPKDQYVNVKDDKMGNVDNFYKIAFSYRERREIVKIYKEVSLMFEQYQKFAHKNYFYVILANLFDPDEQSYQHYLAKPKATNKRYQKCQIVPISFRSIRNGDVIEKRPGQYKHWTEWSYAETQNHLILYWPHEFDFIAYYLSKFLKKNYEPRVSHSIYVSKKEGEQIDKGQNIFYEIVYGEGVQFIPRWGCSAFSLNDQLYIFGGFHQRQNSYLQMQNQITTLDLHDFRPSEFTPRKLWNLRKDLYCGEAFWGKLREKKSINSFVRPRVEFQFFDEQDLRLDGENDLVEEDIKRVIMIGGFGQDFKTPYSLLVNFYYLLRFEISTRRLLSVQKIFVKDKVIPINIKGTIRNRGTFQKTNILQQKEGNDNEERQIKDGITNNNHYFYHRVIYSIVGEGKDKKLQAKIKTLIAMELYENSKKDFENFARKVGEQRFTVDEPQQYRIRMIDDNRHQVIVESEYNNYVFSLNLEIKNEEAPLLNETIIAVDAKQMTIFALLKFSKHLPNISIVASQSVSLPDHPLLQAERHYALTLMKCKSLNKNHDLHTLIACNKNQVLLLHGIGFDGVTVPEKLLKIKQEKESSIGKPFNVSLKHFSSITSFFNKKGNIVECYNFLSDPEYYNIYTIIVCQLDIMKLTEGWKEKKSVRSVRFMLGQDILKHKVSLEIKIDLCSQSRGLFLIAKDRDQSYHANIKELSAQKKEIVFAIIKKEERQRFRYMETLKKIYKSEEKYDDCGYFE